MSWHVQPWRPAISSFLLLRTCPGAPDFRANWKTRYLMRKAMGTFIYNTNVPSKFSTMINQDIWGKEYWHRLCPQVQKWSHGRQPRNALKKVQPYALCLPGTAVPAYFILFPYFANVRSAPLWCLFFSLSRGICKHPLDAAKKSSLTSWGFNAALCRDGGKVHTSSFIRLESALNHCCMSFECFTMLLWVAAMVVTTALPLVRHVMFGGSAVGSRGIASCTMTSKGSPAAAWQNGLWHTSLFLRSIFPLELSFVLVEFPMFININSPHSNKTLNRSDSCIWIPAFELSVIWMVHRCLVSSFQVNWL